MLACWQSKITVSQDVAQMWSLERDTVWKDGYHCLRDMAKGSEAVSPLLQKNLPGSSAIASISQSQDLDSRRITWSSTTWKHHWPHIRKAPIMSSQPQLRVENFWILVSGWCVTLKYFISPAVIVWWQPLYSWWEKRWVIAPSSGGPDCFLELLCFARGLVLLRTWSASVRFLGNL